ncbi:MAG TPA: TasA family protein [Actinomycetes bacterium]|nr:TasA family protein [Actinomycetes bacterium]
MDDLLSEFEQPKERSQESKDRRRRLLATAGIVGLSIVALGSLSTGALFTDQAQIDSDTVVTGSVDINTNPTTSLDFGATNMAPGDSAYAKLIVQNDGSLQLRYSSTGKATNALGGQLDVSVYLLPSSASTCDAASVATATQLFAPAPLGTSFVSMFGDSAVGQQPGDQVLAAGAKDGLCYVATLPLSTDNTFQSTSTTLTLHFDAEQTANNP